MNAVHRDPPEPRFSRRVSSPFCSAWSGRLTTSTYRIGARAYRPGVILRAGLVGGVVSLASDVAWNSITPPGASDLWALAAVAIGAVIWATVGYVASRGVSVRSGSAAAVLVLAIDAGIAKLRVQLRRPSETSGRLGCLEARGTGLAVPSHRLRACH
jgi:hypothetical protein